MQCYTVANVILYILIKLPFKTSKKDQYDSNIMCAGNGGEVVRRDGKFSQRRLGVPIRSRQKFYTWPEHIGNSSRSSSLLTPVEEMEEGKREPSCLQVEEGDAHLWKSAGLQGEVSAMKQMSQSQRLRVQSHLPFFSPFFCWVGDTPVHIQVSSSVRVKTTTTHKLHSEKLLLLLL